LIVGKSNLPVPLTSFIGREQELNALKEIFSKIRLLTLTGVGGCGKTRLSIEFARQMSEQFTDGVWWIELASIQEETAVAQTILRALGLSDSEIDSTEESLVRFLHSRQALLVMDNCEHVIQACARFADSILRQCPSLKILASSREALSIPGEIAWLVPSLSLPPSNQSVDILKWESPRLFFERAATYRPDLQMTASNAEPFLRICRALEGIPLAIELAAARVKTLSLEQLASRLDDKLGLLTTGSRVAQPRQQTLRAAIDWSYELLSEQEQKVLQRLSIFYGTWTLEAAEFVCADGKVSSSSVLDLVTRLLDKSLIVSENQEEEIRYRMLEIIRQYAMEKLGQANEVTTMRDRHTQYYSELAQRAEPAWYSPEQSILIKQFDAHYPNLSVALAWGLEDPGRAANWKNGVKLALALAPCWNFRAELNEGWYWLKKVIEQTDVLLTARDLASVKRTELLSIKAKAIYECGALSYYLTHHATRIDLFQESAEIYREIGDAVGIAYPNLYIAQTASDRGEQDFARQLWSECLARFNEVGDRWYAAMVHSFFGAQERRLGYYDESEREFHQAIDLYNELGDEWGKSIMFSHLAMIAFLRGEPQEARDWFEKRLHIAQQVGFRSGVAYATFLIGITHWKLGEYAQMEKCFRESMPYFHQIGNFGTLADCLMGLAWMEAEAGQLEQAGYLLGAAEKLDETFGRKVYFEYDFFNRPLHHALHARLANNYDEAIQRGKAASVDDVVRDLL
jgi:non-specific serine/threonine protein kinase